MQFSRDSASSAKVYSTDSKRLSRPFELKRRALSISAVGSTKRSVEGTAERDELALQFISYMVQRKN